MFKKILAAASLLGLSLSAHATYFSLSGVIDGSSSYSTTAAGITLTIDNPAPGGLINFPDGFPGIDFGDLRPFFGGTYVLKSFDISFSQSVLLTSIDNPFTVGLMLYWIAGEGMFYAGNLSNPTFSTPLLLEAGQRYTFTTPETASVALIQGFNASVVPVPAAAWLFGSGMVGFAGLARRRHAKLR